MQVDSARTAPQQPVHGRRIAPLARTTATRVALGVAAIGYLVPRADFAGRVHSVFARACNIACDDLLLTLCAPDAGDGPTALRLAPDAPRDLRDLFDVGERVDGGAGCWRTARAELGWSRAALWWPAAPGGLLPRARVEAHIRHAGQRLALRRRTHTSVIDAAAAGAVAALHRACTAFDGEQAARQVDRLIGWGEGLTPAGDDFLIGLLAGLDAPRHGDRRCRGLRGVLAARIIDGLQRTTPIAAHYLRLAVGGHCTEPLIRLRNALLSEQHDIDRVDAALQRALDVGATSGADTVSGLLAGLRVGWPASACFGAA